MAPRHKRGQAFATIQSNHDGGRSEEVKRSADEIPDPETPGQAGHNIIKSRDDVTATRAQDNKHSGEVKQDRHKVSGKAPRYTKLYRLNYTLTLRTGPECMTQISGPYRIAMFKSCKKPG